MAAVVQGRAGQCPCPGVLPACAGPCHTLRWELDKVKLVFLKVPISWALSSWVSCSYGWKHL